MKKTIIGSIAIIAIAAVAAFNVQLNTTDNKLSNISLANVEALANREIIKDKEEDSKCATKYSKSDNGWTIFVEWACMKGMEESCVVGWAIYDSKTGAVISPGNQTLIICN